MNVFQRKNVDTLLMLEDPINKTEQRFQKYYLRTTIFKKSLSETENLLVFRGNNS